MIVQPLLNFYPEKKELPFREKFPSLPRKLFVSFSGGRSSGYMAHKIKTEYCQYFDEVVFGIANTGEETEETLVFSDRCNREFNLGLVWIEGIVHHGERKGSTHKIVTFETASRNGEPFEEFIKKYGIPNQAFPACTRELKLNPLRSYLRSIGWENGSYVSAVGIRSDEVNRKRSDAGIAGIVYPMADWFPITKPEINDWWEEQPFNLGIEDYRGNCKWCWKKSTKKLVRIAKETPEVFDFPARMEELYGFYGAGKTDEPRVFFRQHMTTKNLLKLVQISAVPPPNSDEVDGSSGCSESCEAFLAPNENPDEEE